MRELAPMDTLGRHHPAHQDLREIFNRPTILFLTVCTRDKKPILANEAVHKTLREAWKAADSWLVGRYVLMPDHLHLFCSPIMDTSTPLLQWVSFWKSHAARNWPAREDAPVWQRDFWDTQLRKEESYAEKWPYVVENPVRAVLVARSSDWPYQGEMHSLNW
jgi:putative transposase